MEIIYKNNCCNIDWNTVPRILSAVGMSYSDPEIHKKAFSNSYITVFAFDNEKLIGFGRAISDGVYQAAIYDLAILPEYQGKGIGKALLKRITSTIPNCNYILYAAPGKEGFYEKSNFKKMTTAMALFNNAEEKREKGFIE
ncbi:GNAT family N-acetyltransferase [Clostridium folliculivorans]|uniref:N-acetyltransferase n=1 Tax=Clostridium folliculivorans TaxID=2886038 RepID=A0A9W5Y1I5_9CLOT|nr:GNAT family N-acetyltransferase [Clostridium folliculivorans]GKU24913.1 N-acetyltransferase [Clostridium folliculivorans]GKU31011.1 N-acetyltransferase [Clostridium folliculivorans]